MINRIFLAKIKILMESKMEETYFTCILCSGFMKHMHVPGESKTKTIIREIRGIFEGNCNGFNCHTRLRKRQGRFNCVNMKVRSTHTRNLHERTRKAGRTIHIGVVLKSIKVVKRSSRKVKIKKHMVDTVSGV